MLELKVLECLASAQPTPFAQKILLMIQEKDYKGLMTQVVSANDYQESNIDEFFHDYLLASFLKKCAKFEVVSAEQRYRDAYAKFFEQEHSVRTKGAFFIRTSLTKKRLIQVGKEFGRILGKLETSQMDEISELCAHGPGSSLFFSTTGRRPSDKYTKSAFKCTSALLPYAQSLMKGRWFDEVFGELNWYEWQVLCRDRFLFTRKGLVRDYSTFATVPKTALVDRPIAVEPLLNLYLQKGIGSFIRKRLKYFGIDLQVGQSTNQELVKDAWTLGLATIDLSAASDSISYKILYEIMMVTENGRRWWDLLNLARTSHILIENRDTNEKQLVELEKFSSMGNGFTFELESLLFYCLVRVVVPRRKYQYCSVYGDDIIVPEEHALELIDLLEIYGFTVNPSKTFVTGPFKESCGHDYYKTQNCRPIFAGKSDDIQESSAISDEVKLANAIRLYSFKIHDGFRCSPKYKKAYALCLKEAKLPADYPRVPPEMGGQGLIVPFSDAIKRKEIKALGNHLEGYSIPIMTFKAHMERSRKTSFLLHALISIGRTDFASKGYESVLRSGGKIKRASAIVPYWDDSMAWDQ